MPWHVGSDYQGGPLHYSCGVAGEDERLVVEEGDGCCKRGRRRRGGGRCVVVRAVGAREGVRVLPGCKERRRSSTQQLGTISFHQLKSPLTHPHSHLSLLNTADSNTICVSDRLAEPQHQLLYQRKLEEKAQNMFNSRAKNQKHHQKITWLHAADE